MRVNYPFKQCEEINLTLRHTSTNWQERCWEVAWDNQLFSKVHPQHVSYNTPCPKYVEVWHYFWLEGAAEKGLLRNQGGLIKAPCTGMFWCFQTRHHLMWRLSVRQSFYRTPSPLHTLLQHSQIQRRGTPKLKKSYWQLCLPSAGFINMYMGKMSQWNPTTSHWTLLQESSYRLRHPDCKGCCYNSKGIPSH